MNTTINSPKRKRPFMYLGTSYLEMDMTTKPQINTNLNFVPRIFALKSQQNRSTRNKVIV